MGEAQEWTAWMERLEHPLVRDLAWLCVAPDLVVMQSGGRPTLAELGLEDQNPGDQKLREFLEAQDSEPQHLQVYMQSAIKRRLGHYHERLWQYLLTVAPNSELLAHNLPITRERTTLGEMDILYRSENSATPIHLEVAIKFYLGLPEGPEDPASQARWIGPGGLDSLAGKRHHLHYHQLPIAGSAEARNALQRFTPQNNGLPFAQRLSQRIAMPGRLFYPWRPALPAPRDAYPDHLQGKWLSYRDWPSFRDNLTSHAWGHWLAKPHWLAPPRIETLLPISRLEPMMAQHFFHRGWPLALALYSEADSWQRLFLVNDRWPPRIPLPPIQSSAVFSSTH
ncbi:DUF1853 family protein [Pistricoccus aurantiacus]|uniref:DUF1853 family protein n=1 Tax=Pistricoccus aurantiacus TaxID=1883414 RepID=UPI00363D70E6